MATTVEPRGLNALSLPKWAKPPPARAPRYTEPLAQLTAGDWVFVCFAATVILWTVYITIGELTESDFDFDFLPVAAGVPIVLMGWRLLRVKEQVDEVVRGLSGGAGLDLIGDIERFESELGRRARLWSLGSGAAIAFVFAGFLAWAVTTGLYRVEGTVGDIFLFVLLLTVCVVAGFIIGGLLGRLLGCGQILMVMRDTGITIGRIDTPQARSAIDRMEDVLRYAFIATVAMCHWFALWFGFWFLGGRNYRATYWVLFILLWAVSYGFYLFAARAPTIAFQLRLDEIRGGPDAQQARQRQLDEARDDLARLRQINRERHFEEEQELEAIVKEFEARGAPRRLPPRWALDLIAIWIAVLLIGSLVFSLRSAVPAPAERAAHRAHATILNDELRDPTHSLATDFPGGSGAALPR